jgi:hypothetical protein
MWKSRAIRVVPKVAGSSALKDVRPITLLDVLCKCLYRTLIKRVYKVWEDHQLLSKWQWAFRGGAGAEQPLTLLQLISEDSFARKETLLAMSQDISKAYDYVHRHMAQEMALRRLGVPEDIIHMFIEVHRGNSIDMLTAYGKSSDILGASEGTFEALRGIAQGGSEGPLVWVAVYDILLCMQYEGLSQHGPAHVGGAEERTEVAGWAFADDAIWLATSRAGLQHRCNVAELYFDFMGMQFNAAKSKVTGVEWWGHRHLCALEAGLKPRISNLESYFTDSSSGPKLGKELGIASVHEGVKYLGIQWSPLPFQKLDPRRLEQLQNLVRKGAARIKLYALRPASQWYLMDAVVWGRVQWHLMTATYTEGQLNSLEAPAKACAVRAAGIEKKGLSDDLVRATQHRGGLGLTSWYDRVMAKRLQLASQALREGGIMAVAIRHALDRVAERAGVPGNVLAEKTLSSWKGARDTMEQLAVWVAKNGWEFRPHNDSETGARPRSIMSLFNGTAAEGRVRELCNRCDIRFTSQLLCEDGKTLCTETLKANGQGSQAAKEVAARLGVKRKSGGHVTSEFWEEPRMVLQHDRLTPGSDVLVTSSHGGRTVRRLAQVKSIRAQVEIQYYDVLQEADMEAGGDVLVMEQGDWELARLVSLRRVHGGRLIVRLHSTSQEEPRGQIKHYLDSEIDPRQGALYRTADSTWSLAQHTWRLSEERGLVAKEDIVRLRMTGALTSRKIVQAGLDITTLHAHAARQGGTEQTHTRMGLGRGSERLLRQAETHCLEWEEEPEIPAEGKRWHMFSDGSKKATKGTYGFLGNTPAGVRIGGGACNMVWGGHDSYRTDAYGALAVISEMRPLIPYGDGIILWCDIICQWSKRSRKYNREGKNQNGRGMFGTRLSRHSNDQARRYRCAGCGDTQRKARRRRNGTLTSGATTLLTGWRRRCMPCSQMTLPQPFSAAGTGDFGRGIKRPQMTCSIWLYFGSLKDTLTLMRARTHTSYNLTKRSAITHRLLWGTRAGTHLGAAAPT